ncbi:MAG: Membrane-bound lytic murein transglycosylase D [Anaerolineales bacterium]|nr:Membrane-bound lytic murein transglycosylase D [Anaerolineales bacterium]
MRRVIALLGGLLLSFVLFGLLDILGVLDSHVVEPPISNQTDVGTDSATSAIRTSHPADALPPAQADIVGLGRARDSIQSVFEKPEVGFTFETSPEVGGEPRLLGRSPNGRTVIQLVGPAENLVSASVIVNLSADVSTELTENEAYLLGLLKLAVPSWTVGADWARENIEIALETGEAETTYAHLRIHMQWLRDYDAMLLTVADGNWGIPALATIPVPEPAQVSALPDTPAPTTTPELDHPPTAPAGSASGAPQDGGGVTARAPEAGDGPTAIDAIVREADMSEVVNLILQALSEYRGLSLDDNSAIYGAIGRTERALDLLYETGATGDVFRAAEDLLRTQLDVLRAVEAAVLSEDIADLKTVAPLLIDLGERRLVFNRQLGNSVFAPAYTQQELSVVSIVRDDAALRSVMAEVMAALAEGRPVDLDISDQVYQALSETSRGLDLIDEVGETGDVFEAAVGVLQHRRQFLIDLEKAVISGDIGDLRAVTEDWVSLSQEQLRFERQLAARGDDIGSRVTPSDTPKTDRPVDEMDVDPEAGGQIDQANDGRQVNQADTTPHVYIVQEGDTLGAIAARFGTTVGRLAKLNNIARPTALDPGTSLLINMPPYLYEIHPGDTLSDIAHRHGLDVAMLVQINQLESADFLLAGQKLLISEDQ